MKEASVETERGPLARIDRGLVILLGVAAGDGPDDGQYLADKILHLRIFDDEHGKLNRSVLETGGGLLLVSQFTLLADCRRGRRPDFLRASSPEAARPLYAEVAGRLRDGGATVLEGLFGERMLVRIANDGPVTILLDSRDR